MTTIHHLLDTELEDYVADRLDDEITLAAIYLHVRDCTLCRLKVRRLLEARVAAEADAP